MRHLKMIGGKGFGAVHWGVGVWNAAVLWMASVLLLE
jgi:hypothetical protein